MRVFISVVSIIPILTLSACQYPRVTQHQYAYSFLAATETYASTRRNIGEIFIFDPNESGGKLEILDKTLSIDDADLVTTVPANIDNSRVSGAQITLAVDANNSVTGAAQFEAKVDADALQIRSMSRADVSDKIEQLYAELRGQDPSSTELPLDARRVDKENLMYAVISGAGAADKLLLSHGTPEGTDSGFDLTINGQKYAEVKISNRIVFECAKSDAGKPQCTADITVYTAKLTERGGGTRFDAKPASISKAKLTQLFQNTFSN